MTSPDSMPLPPDLVLARVLDAPRSLVFKAWTDPVQLARWWGPRGFTNPLCQADPRPGGAIRILMVGPDGSRFPMDGAFQEVVEPSRLAFTCTAHEVAPGVPGLETLTVATFEERGGRTTLRVVARVLHADPVMAQALAGMEQGWGQSLVRLQDLVDDLALPPADPLELALVRCLDAPPERVFRAWSDPAELARWWGPDGFTSTFDLFEFRPGGSWRFTMHGPDGTGYRNQVEFVEIVPPRRMVMLHLSAPRFLLTADFAERDGGTRLSFRQRFETPEECQRMRPIAGPGSRQTLGWLREVVEGTNGCAGASGSRPG